LNVEKPVSFLLSNTYQLSMKIPIVIFNKNYPVNPKNFGDRLRSSFDSKIQKTK
jgi:hypothetical protein